MPHRSKITIAITSGVICVGAIPASASAASVPGEIVVGYAHGTGADQQDAIATAAGTNAAVQISSRTQVVTVQSGESTAAAIRRLKDQPGVKYAVPNLIAHASYAGDWVPNDLGRLRSGTYPGWQLSQWNFMRNSGVGAIDAWNNLKAAGKPGGRGVKIAVIDSGIAYMNWGRFRRSPDFVGTRFAHGWDFVRGNGYALDRNGHGTHVAGTIAETTNNRRYMAGLAWGATIIPERVLDGDGNGDSADIARAIRYAADKGAAVANLSIEFDPGTTASQIPEIIDAINYATARGTLVVSAAGNDADTSVTYPAKYSPVLAVGATTEHRCLADYSNFGDGLDIVAPGGGPDADISGDAKCHPFGKPGRDIVQLGLSRGSSGAAAVPYRFILDAEDGTSMATPHVSAAAALVVASGVLGAHPTPAQITAHLLATADPTTDSNHYGAGLLDAGRATKPLPPT